MPPDTSIKLDPYTSTVPLVQLPPQERAQPLPTSAGYMGTAGKAAAIGDSIFGGLMKGLATKEQHKYAAADATIKALDSSTGAAFGSYQQIASEKGVDSPEGKAAYEAYLKQFNDAKEQKAKFIIPDEKKKPDPAEKKKSAVEKFGGGIQEFFQRNPHIIPEISLMAMQPQKPGLTTDTQQTKNKLTEQGQNIELNKQAIESNKQKATQDAIHTADQAAEKKVEESGGYEHVLSDPTATPDQRQAANRMKATLLDKLGPDARRKEDLTEKVMAGKPLTEAEHIQAGMLGVIPEPKMTKITGKNGHEMQIMVDPTTGQPIPGSKPLDLGPPEWASRYYAERATEKRDIQSAVSKNPEAYGITLTGDKKTDSARIDARTSMLFAESEEHIKATAGLTGKLPGEVQRDNAVLKDVYTDIDKLIPKKGSADFKWTNGQKVTLDKDQMNGILGQFMSDPQETPGNYAFRSKVQIPPGKDWQAAERDRKWAYQLVKNRMMAQKGKAVMTAEQADAVLAGTALGKPLSAADATPAAPGDAPKKGFWRSSLDAIESIPGKLSGTSEGKSSGGLTPPPAQQSSGGVQIQNAPSPGAKLYAVKDEQGNMHGYYLNDQQFQQAQQQGIAAEPIPDAP